MYSQQQPGYGMQGGYSMQQMANTSGQGPNATIPPEIQGLNWGAFLLNWIWGLGNGVMLALLSLIVPFFPFFLLVKGNELAWRNKQWASVEDFLATQRKWTRWGVIFLIVSFVLSCVITLLVFVLIAAASSSS